MHKKHFSMVILSAILSGCIANIQPTPVNSREVPVVALTQLAKPIHTPTMGYIPREAQILLSSYNPVSSSTPTISPASSPTKFITTTPFDEELMDFIGIYRLGDGLGMNLILSINLNYTYSFRGYTDTLASWENTGKFSISKGNLQLAVDKYVMFEPHSLSLVRWGERRYLIDDERMSEFCEWIEKGWEPRNSLFGSFFLKAKDWETPIDGHPVSIQGVPVCP